jgi:hypothetical protein
MERMYTETVLGPIWGLTITKYNRVNTNKLPNFSQITYNIPVQRFDHATCITMKHHHIQSACGQAEENEKHPSEIVYFHFPQSKKNTANKVTEGRSSSQGSANFTEI